VSARCEAGEKLEITSKAYLSLSDYPISGEYEIITNMEDVLLDNPCDTCDNAGWETMSKVAACNCCENHEFYSPTRKEFANGTSE